MRLTLDALAVLDAISRRGSFAAAAEELHRVPSAITYTVHKLEQDLDVQVFDRSGHRARLTAVGECLLQEGRELLRAAVELEGLVKRVASGWEPDLGLVVGEWLPVESLLPLCAEFAAEGHGTRLHLHSEIGNGAWEALVQGRADLAIGVACDGPPGGGYASRALGCVALAFVCAPTHVLAGASEPLDEEQIQRGRSVALADSSRQRPLPTIAGAAPELVVGSMPAWLAALRAGLDAGFVARRLVAAELADGRLIEKTVQSPPPPLALQLAWRNNHGGRALKWFLRALETPGRLDAWLDTRSD
ncbi:LysR substrate-binding domain-containing protein [Plasticicumulans acidivorans]|uniref:LysR family transcriptional regulator n=1 Tax=Plasticicumulans acidivorans TaxID=886464 RepID=A0A317MTM0_9GAMM|nr:LysR substrate-binding domain-containing protein [Plasticicumulans acidivorans]PWV60693.1 LysR family transcriptional regulator [Plasticicumulans acidivorans]